MKIKKLFQLSLLILFVFHLSLNISFAQEGTNPENQENSDEQTIAQKGINPDLEENSNGQTIESNNGRKIGGIPENTQTENPTIPNNVGGVTANQPPTPSSTCDPDCDQSTEYCDNGKCECDPLKTCCGVKLNTNVPFIGNCIMLLSPEQKARAKSGTNLNNTVSGTNLNNTVITDKEVFPVLMGGLTKILVTIILLFSFVAIIVAGVMITASGPDDSTASKGKKLIGNVIVGLALLGASGVILRLINPNFFG